MNNHIYTIIILLFTACTTSNSTSTYLDSNDFENKADRIEKLEMEIICFSDILDAEFDLFNVNGFHNQRNLGTGASSWDYKFAIKVDTINIPKWTLGMTEVELTNEDENWTKEITKQRKQNWETHSKPQYYIRIGEEVTMIVYKKEGIIFKHVTID